ncbi:MAG TPA: methyltransferase domain-containing protein [Polyangia bacterium]|nr:methyltransferase domain-containing protein [Polyangia bacterium]
MRQTSHRAPPAVEQLGLLLLALDRFAAAPAESRRSMVSLLERTHHRPQLIYVFRRLDQTLSFQVALGPAVDWILDERPEWAIELQDLTHPLVQRALAQMGALPPTLLNADALITREVDRRWRGRKRPPEAPILFDGRFDEMEVNIHEFRSILCPLDNEPFDEVIGRVRINGEELRVMRHSSDGMMAMNPQPGPRYFETMYSSFYFKQHGESTEQVGIRAYSAEEAARRTGLADVQIDEWERLAGARPPGKMMEVGPGGGYLMEAASRRGWDVRGVDLSAFVTAQLRARGLHVEQGTLEEYSARHPEAAGTFDVIALYDLLEHVPDPQGFLQAVRHLLGAGGVLVIRTPNNAGAEPALHLLDHLWHFTPETLSQLLTRNRLSFDDAKPSGIFHAGSDRTLENMTVFARHADR